MSDFYGVKRSHGTNGSRGGALYEARINVDGNYVHLGSFDTARDAAKAVDIGLIMNGLEPRNATA